MLDVVISHGFMPEEVYSEKDKMANDFSPEKVILYEISRQARISEALCSIDAANC